jgi:2'-5' RNA ligase
MSSDADTVPTLQIIQESIKALAEEMRLGFAAVNNRLSAMEHQLERMDIRLDGIEGFANQTRSEVMYLRKEFKEFRSQFNQPA